MATTTFDGLHIDFDERVLSPRPWTAAQARWAAELAESAPEGPILELCCGAGHIGLAAAARTGRHLHQVDIDPTACGYARSNAAAAGLADRVQVWCRALDDDWPGPRRYPIIIADPPYLTPRQAADYPDDPPLAVLGGDDGLDVVRTCLRAITRRLHPRGAAVLQVRGAEQVHAVVEHLARWQPGLAAHARRHFSADRALLLLGRSS
jgi:HemK-like putative methylase